MPAGAEQGQMLSSILMLVLMVVVFYFVLIRPQKKKEKKVRDMIAALKVGDEVASIGGIHGKIIKIKDDVFVLETGAGTTKSYVSLERGSIARLVKEGKAKASEVEAIPDEFEEIPEITEE